MKRLSLGWTLIAACALSLSACTSEDEALTEVIVLVNAQSAVRQDADSLVLRVERLPSGELASEQTVRAPIDWRVKLALVPAGDASSEYRVTAAALRGDEALSVARLHSGYVEGEKRYVELLLETDCRERFCASDATCHADGCVAAYVDPELFGTSEANAPVAAEIAQPLMFDGSFSEEGGMNPFDASSDAEVSDGDVSDAQLPPELSEAIGEVGAPCVTGTKACPRHDTRQRLLCIGGIWQTNVACESEERCDTRLGDTAGECLPIPSECADHEGGEAFCAGDAIRVCPDRLVVVDDACQANATCALDDEDVPECVCKPGFAADGDACVDVLECAEDNGGCDMLAACVEEPGAFHCGACTSGYKGNGDVGCTVALASLTVASGVLAPVFDPEATSYAVRVPFRLDSVEVTPTAAASASLTLDGGAFTSGESFSFSDLAIGESEMSVLAVEEAGRGMHEVEVTARRGTEVVKLTPPSEDVIAFGSSIALDGDTLLVGAGGDIDHSGFAYVYRRVDEVWTLEATLMPDLVQAYNGFGWSVDLDGDTAVISATTTDAGAVYVFTRSGNTWSRQTRIDSPGSYYWGAPLVVQGDMLLVGDTNSAGGGVVHVYRRSGSSWTRDGDASFQAPTPRESDYFGRGLVIDGDTLAVTSYAADNRGIVHVYVRSGEDWVLQDSLQGVDSEVNDQFAGIALDGDTLIAGASQESSNAIGVAGDSTNNSAPGAGAAYVFVRSGSTWTQQAYVKATNTDASDAFGGAAAVEGDFLVVTAGGESSSGSGFPAPTPDDDSLDRAGAAYLYVRSGSSWAPLVYLKPSTPVMYGYFGANVEMEGDTFVIGARNIDTANSETNGVYVFY